MRIVGGKHRGRTINPPKNLKARPTTDFAKEALFNILANQIDFESINVLDLFAGTGSIGYEFASRGAMSVVSVEISNTHHNFIKRMVDELGLGDFFVVKANVFLYLKNCRKSFDVIFSDAPYDLPGADRVIDLVLDGDILNDDGLLIVEHGKEYSFVDHPNHTESRSYGSVVFSFFRR